MTYADQFVEDGAQQAHLYYLSHKHPDNDENQDADKHVERSRFAHEAIDVVEHERY